MQTNTHKLGNKVCSARIRLRTMRVAFGLSWWVSVGGMVGDDESDIGIDDDLLESWDEVRAMVLQKMHTSAMKTLPLILRPPHADLIVQAHSGSGKTACFVLSMLSRVDPAVRRPQLVGVALCARRWCWAFRILDSTVQ